MTHVLFRNTPQRRRVGGRRLAAGIAAAVAIATPAANLLAGSAAASWAAPRPCDTCRTASAEAPSMITAPSVRDVCRTATRFCL